MDKSGMENTEKTAPARIPLSWKRINGYFDLIAKWIFHLRKVLLAAPVVYYALKLAMYNREHLPQEVGINLLSNGEFAMTVTKGIAVAGPLALTVACLLLLFCSRKALYPWAVSVFTLALPVLILVSNLYPA